MKWQLFIDADAVVDEKELFPDGTHDGLPPTLEHVADLLADTALNEFLMSWDYADLLTIEFKDDDGRIFTAWANGRYVGRWR